MERERERELTEEKDATKRGKAKRRTRDTLLVATTR